jgi:hypothetical protein
MRTLNSSHKCLENLVRVHLINTECILTKSIKKEISRQALRKELIHQMLELAKKL